MQWCPPLNMATVDRGGPQIIIDRSLALDLHGPLLTLRMASECDTWVAPSVWRALDDSLIQMTPMIGTDIPDPEPLNRPLPERAVAIWERVRVLTSGRRLYWLAEAREDAHLPEWVTPESFARFETLHEALQADANDANDDAVVDALVLAAAFQERAAAVLCTCPDGTPEIVAEAAAQGMHVTELAEDASAQVRDHWFSPLLMRTGLFEWVRTRRTPVAFVRLIAPDLLFLETELFEVEDRNAARMRGWPNSAALLWGRL